MFHFHGTDSTGSSNYQAKQVWEVVGGRRGKEKKWGMQKILLHFVTMWKPVKLIWFHCFSFAALLPNYILSLSNYWPVWVLITFPRCRWGSDTFYSLALFYIEPGHVRSRTKFTSLFFLSMMFFFSIPASFR